MNDYHAAIHSRLHAEADMIYGLHCFGDYLAKREGYRVHKGIDAVHYYLILKHGWLPAAVRSMNPLDLCFALEEELCVWTLPQECRP